MAGYSRQVLILLSAAFIGSGTLLGSCKPSHAEQTDPFARSAWKESDYQKINYLQFKKFEPANEKIEPENPDLPLLSAAVFYEVNLMRQRYDLPYLQYLPALRKSARMHSRDMAEHNFFSNFNQINPDKISPDIRMEMFGINVGYRAENIARAPAIMYRSGEKFRRPIKQGGPLRDFETRKPIPFHTYNGLAEVIVDGWMRNSGYRQNILNKKFSYTGTGSATRPDKELFDTLFFYVTQDFASHNP